MRAQYTIKLFFKRVIGIGILYLYEYASAKRLAASSPDHIRVTRPKLELDMCLFRTMSFVRYQQV